MDDRIRNSALQPEELTERTNMASEYSKPILASLALDQLHLGDSEQLSLFENLLGAMPDAIFISDVEGRILLANEQATMLFNYRREELVRQSIEMLMPERFRKAHGRHQHDYWKESQTRPMGIGLDLVGQSSDGREFPVEISLSPLQFAGRELVVSSVRDISKRIRTQKNARLREERFLHLIDSLPICISYTDKQHRYQLNNKTYEEWFGLSQEEIAGRHVREVLGDAVYNASRKRIEAALSGQEQNFEATLPIPSGGNRNVMVSYTPDRDENGQVRGFFTVVADISDRIQAEAALLEEEARYHFLYDNTPVMMHSIDREGRVRSVNKHWLKVMGYRREEVIGHPTVDFLSERSRQQAIDVELPIFFRSGIARDVPYQMVKKDGDVIDVLLSAVMKRDENDEMLYSTAFLLDVTERKRAERDTRESERKFRRIFEYSNDAIFLLQPTGNIIVDANSKACEMLGYTREELLSIGIAAIHPNEMPELIAFAESVSDDGHGWTNELTCTTKFGQVLPAEMSASIVNIEGQDCMIAVVRDTTERKAAEKRIRQEAFRAESLARVAARLNAHLSLDGVINAVCEETALAMDADSILLLLFDDKKEILVPAAHTGMPSGFVEQYTPLPIELYESSVDPLNPIIVLADVSESADLPNSRLFEKYNTQSIAAVSLVREQQLIGMLGIYCFHEQREFSPDELALLKGLADQATQAIDNARLRIQAEQTAVTEERNRLARDLHDSVTQSLYSQMLYSEAASRRLAAGEVKEVSEHLGVLRQTAHQALQEMRLLIFELRPPILDEQGLVAAINARLEAVEERSGQHTELNADSDLRLPPDLESSFYRIVQEALNNVLKHANAQEVIISLTQNGDLVTLEIIDDGLGFDIESSQLLGSYGLQGMRERVSQIGGSMNVHSKPGEGTRVIVEVSI